MNDVSACIRVAACICSKDGVISAIEEQTLYQRVIRKFPDFDAEHFDQVLTDFFNSDEQIEDYLSYINDPEIQQFTLTLAEVSASSDGLDIRENIALEKAYLIWGLRADV